MLNVICIWKDSKIHLVKYDMISQEKRLFGKKKKQ